jgi:glycosyltransferase involved in cell wall biosynthesis
MISQKSGKFDLVHVNILTRMGILALLLKTRYGIPYIITEHWSRYLPITGTYKGVIRKFLTRLVVKNASAVTTVTLNLAHAMQAHQLKHNNYQVINNVANTDLFTPNIKAGSALKNILHVSCFEDRSKNLSGLLRAIKRLSQDRKDFKVAMVGDGQDFALIKTYAAELGIPNDQIEFTGLLENQELIEVFRGSHFMVMFSNYENMPVVINEAMCCGLPVVATQVGGIPEIVSNKFGILVKARDENALVTSLHRMLDTYTLYNSDEIRDFAIKNFSVQSIGKKFSDIYLDILHDKK